jgi:hypothetical protein
MAGLETNCCSDATAVLMVLQLNLMYVLLDQPLHEGVLKKQLEQQQKVDTDLSCGQHSRVNNISTIQAQWLPDSSGQLHAVSHHRYKYASNGIAEQRQ